MPFEPKPGGWSSGGREGLVERSFTVDAKVVLDENNDLGGGEASISEVLQDMSVVHGGVTIGHLDAAPAFELREHHEEIGDAVALIFVVRNGPGGPVSSGSAGASRR